MMSNIDDGVAVGIATTNEHGERVRASTDLAHARAVVYHERLHFFIVRHVCKVVLGVHKRCCVDM